MFPTEEHVEDSHLGVNKADSIILSTKIWDDTKDFPKACMTKQESHSKKLDGNLYHAKYIIISNKSD